MFQVIIAAALTVIAACGLFIAPEVLEIRRFLMSISSTLSLWPKGHLTVPCDRPISTLELGLMAYSVRNNIQRHKLHNAKWEPVCQDITTELVDILNTLIKLDPDLERICYGHT